MEENNHVDHNIKFVDKAKLQYSTSSLFNRNEIELVKRMRTIKCKFMETGLKRELMEFYYCDCDPNNDSPICVECARNCHKDHNLSPLQRDYQICSCGMKNHVVQNNKNQEYAYQKVCFFNELSLQSNAYFNFFYENNARESNNTFNKFQICAFCYFFCVEEFTQQKPDIQNKFNKVDLGNANQVFHCNCPNDKHTDINYMYSKLNEICDVEFRLEYNIPSQKIFNLIFLCQKSFNNLYNNFINTSNKIKYLNSNKTYNDKNFKNIVTSNNAFFHVNKKILNTNFYRSIKNFATWAKKIHHVYYFNPEAENYLDFDVIKNLLDEDIDQNKNSFNAINFILLYFQKVHLGNFFSSIQNFKVKDFQNLTPFQRLSIIENFKHGFFYLVPNNESNENNDEYFNTNKNNFDIYKINILLDKFFKFLIKLNSNISNISTGLAAIERITSIIKKFAKFYLVSEEKMIRFSKIVEKLLKKFYLLDSGKSHLSSNQVNEEINSKQEIHIHETKTYKFTEFIGKNEVESKNIKFSIIKNILKTLHFFCLAKNDNILLMLMQSVQNPNAKFKAENFYQILSTHNFVFGNSEVGIEISRNLMDIMELIDSDDLKKEKKISTQIFDLTNALTSIIFTKEDWYLQNLVKTKESDFFKNLKYFTIENYNSFSGPIRSNTTNKFNSNAKAKEFTNENAYFEFFTNSKRVLQKKYFEFYNFKISINDLIHQANENAKSVIQKMQINNNQQFANLEDHSMALDEEEKEFHKMNSPNRVQFNNNRNHNKVQNQNKTNDEYYSKAIALITNYINNLLRIFYIIDRESLNNNFSNSENQDIEKIVLKNKKTEEDFMNKRNFNWETISNILKILYFTANENPENCVMLLTNENLYFLMKIPLAYLSKILDFIIFCLNTIVNQNYEFFYLNKLIKEVINSFYKVYESNLLEELKSKNFSKILQILKIISNNFISKDNFKNREYIRKELKEIFFKNKTINEFKQELLDNAKNLFPIEPSNEIKSDNQNNKFQIEENKNENYKDIGSLRLDNFDGKSFPAHITNTENNLINFNSKNSLRQFYFFISLVNDYFDENAMLESDSGLERILNLQEIFLILKIPNLPIHLRTEILKFFRMCYVDVFIDSNKMTEYRYIITKDYETGEEIFKGENIKMFNFFEKLISVSEVESNIDKGFDLLIYETRNFKEFLKYNSDPDNSLILNYFENGIILTLKVFLNKIFAKTNNVTGLEMIKLYELVYLLLLTKQFLIEQSIFNNIGLEANTRLGKNLQHDLKIENHNPNKYKNIPLKDNKYFDKNPHKPSANNHHTNNIIIGKNYNNHLIEEDTAKRDDLKINNNQENNNIKSESNLTKTIIARVNKRVSVNYSSLNATELEKIKKSINLLTDKSFKFMDISAIHHIVSENLENFFEKPSSSQLIEDFEEKDKHQNQDFEFFLRIEKKNYYKNTNNNSIPNINQLNEEKIINFLAYYNYQKNSENNSCINILVKENHNLHEVSYRTLILKYCFFILKYNNIFYYNEILQAGIIILNFLMKDTSNTQKDILFLLQDEGANNNGFNNSKKSKIIDLKHCIEFFFKNFISVIFTQFNPCSVSITNEYYICCLVIKIFKFLCEEHNQEFQEILLSRLSFQIEENKKIMFYDMMLMIVDKIAFLSQWAKPKIKETDNIDHFSALFSCLINMLIEIIQGTKKENFTLLYREQIKESTEDLFEEEFKNDNENSEKRPSHLVKKQSIKYHHNHEKNVINHNYHSNSKNHNSQKHQSHLTGNKEPNFEYKAAKMLRSYFDPTIESGKSLKIFINNIKPILFNVTADNASLYKIRQLIANFILAFMEECSCPESIKTMIIKKLPSSLILRSICCALKKYYLNNSELLNNNIYFKITMGETFIKNHSSNVINSVPDSNKLSENNLESEVSNHNTNNNLKFNNYNHNSENPYNRNGASMNKKMSKKRSKVLKFSEKIVDYFDILYFKKQNLSSAVEFNFSVSLYTYFKLNILNKKSEESLSLWNKIHKISTRSLHDFNARAEDLNSHGLVKSCYPTKNVDNTNIYDEYDFEYYYVIKFFEKICKNVTIALKDNTETIIVFLISPTVNLLSVNSKKEFERSVNRDSRYSKLYSLILETEYFLEEINFNASANFSNFLKFSYKIDYQIVGILVFILACIINIALLSILEDGGSNFKGYDSLNIIKYITISLMLLNFVFIILWFICKLPLYFKIEMLKFKNRLKLEGKENITFLNRLSVLLVDSMLKKPEITVLIWIFICFLIGEILEKNSFAYSMGLLSVINLSQVFNNIFLSVFLKWKHLVWTLVFSFIIMYLFACYGFFYDTERFYSATLDENLCSSLISCFLTVSNVGLRNRAGIGLILSTRSFFLNPGEFTSRTIYDVLFFILIVIMMLKIIFGIIVDTFRMLREKEFKKERDIINRCFICNIEKDVLEKNSINFEEHCKKDHFIWDYAYYIITLRLQDSQDLNANNSYVKEQIEIKSISWFPSSAHHLEHIEKEDIHDSH